MINFRSSILILSLGFIFSCGQQKQFVSYKMKQGETIEQIAKRYNISKKELLKLNPDIKNEKAVGTIIVPYKRVFNPITKVKKSNPKIKNTNTDSVITNSNGNTEEPNAQKFVEKTFISYTTHTVQPKETVYALTKKYGISKDELIRLNSEFPELKNNKLSIGQVLKVKEIKTTKLVPLAVAPKEFMTHTVQPKETMYSLTKLYNVTREDIIRLNPELPDLKSNKLSIGNVIKIKKIDPSLITRSEIENLVYNDKINFGESINLALLLPFDAKRYDETEPEEIFKNKLNSSIADFYLGSEIAIDSLTQQGVNIKFNVFDTGRKGRNTPKIINSKKLDDMDVIIGPFYTNQAKLISEKVKRPIIFPHFSKHQDDFKSEEMITASPGVSAYIHKLTNYLTDIYNGENIFVVGDGTASSDRKVSEIVQDLKLHDSINNIIVLKPEDGYIKKERFTDKMEPKSKNWVILTSNDNVAVADALNSFVVLPEEVTAQVFALTKNKAYDKIDNNQLARLELIYVSDDYVNDTDPKTKVFNRKFKAKNYTLPSRYATKGFDVTYDILARLSSGEKLKKTFNKGTSSRIANKFSFVKDPNFGTTQNTGLFIVKHNKDLSLTKLR